LALLHVGCGPRATTVDYSAACHLSQRRSLAITAGGDLVPLRLRIDDCDVSHGRSSL
jgi:hypothetical protein